MSAFWPKRCPLRRSDERQVVVVVGVAGAGAGTRGARGETDNLWRSPMSAVEAIQAGHYRMAAAFNDSSSRCCLR
jgi:hypothetical protein